MCVYFKVEFAVAQNLIDDVLLTLTVRGPFHREGKNKFCMLNLTKRAEAPTSRYSATGNFLPYIYYVLVAKNPQKIQSRCFFKEIFHRYFLTILKYVNPSYMAAILKKNSLWLLPFYIAVATYCYFEKVHRKVRTVIVS